MRVKRLESPSCRSACEMLVSVDESGQRRARLATEVTKKKWEVILGSIEGQGLSVRGVHPRIAQTDLERLMSTVRDHSNREGVRAHNHDMSGWRFEIQLFLIAHLLDERPSPSCSEKVGEPRERRRLRRKDSLLVE